MINQSANSFRIEEGRRYITRDGRVTSPIKKRSSSTAFVYGAFIEGNASPTYFNLSGFPMGGGKNCGTDLVGELTEAAPVTNDTPVGCTFCGAVITSAECTCNDALIARAKASPEVDAIGRSVASETQTQGDQKVEFKMLVGCNYLCANGKTITLEAEANGSYWGSNKKWYDEKGFDTSSEDESDHDILRQLTRLPDAVGEGRPEDACQYAVATYLKRYRESGDVSLLRKARIALTMMIEYETRERSLRADEIVKS